MMTSYLSHITNRCCCSFLFPNWRYSFQLFALFQVALREKLDLHWLHKVFKHVPFYLCSYSTVHTLYFYWSNCCIISFLLVLCTDLRVLWCDTHRFRSRRNYPPLETRMANCSSFTPGRAGISCRALRTVCVHGNELYFDLSVSSVCFDRPQVLSCSLVLSERWRCWVLWSSGASTRPKLVRGRHRVRGDDDVTRTQLDISSFPDISFAKTLNWSTVKMRFIWLWLRETAATGLTWSVLIPDWKSQ